MNNGGVGLKPEEQQQQQRGDRPPPQYLDEVLHPTAPHPRFAKNVYIELAAFSDSIYERGRMSRVQIAIDSIQYPIPSAVAILRIGIKFIFFGQMVG